MTLYKLYAHRRSFDLKETGDVYEATIKVRILCKDGVRTNSEEGALIVTKRAVSEAANVYSYYLAQVDSVSLEDLKKETAHD